VAAQQPAPGAERINSARPATAEGSNHGRKSISVSSAARPRKCERAIDTPWRSKKHGDAVVARVVKRLSRSASPTNGLIPRPGKSGKVRHSSAASGVTRKQNTARAVIRSADLLRHAGPSTLRLGV